MFSDWSTVSVSIIIRISGYGKNTKHLVQMNMLLVGYNTLGT